MAEKRIYSIKEDTYEELKVKYYDLCCHISFRHPVTTYQPTFTTCSQELLDTVIEYDGVLFFTRKLSISVKQGHFFGLGLGKIKVSGDILVTRCPLLLAVFFSS